MNKLIALVILMQLITCNAYAALSVSSVDPSSGIAIGENIVTFTGTGLADVNYVDFGGYQATIQSRSDTQLTVVVPNAYTWGSVGIELDTNSDYKYLPSAYTYIGPEFTSIVPNEGSIAGGTDVTIHGNYFAGITGISFDYNYATTFSVIDESTITVTTPSSWSGEGTFNIQIETDTNTLDVPNAFTYTTATLDSVSPGNGSIAGGTTVTLQGAGLNAVSYVYIDGIEAVINSQSDTSIEITTPEYSAGTWGIQIELTTGDVLDTGKTFTYTSPSISAMNPIYGPVDGGTNVTLSGSGLSAISDIMLDGYNANITSKTDTSLTFVTPVATSPGEKNIQVNYTTGDSELIPNTFIYINDIPITKTYVAGDLAPRGNPDGQLNVADVLVMERIVSGIIEPTETERYIADVAPYDNADGVVNVSDVLVLERAVNGEIVLPPVQVGINFSTAHINETISGNVIWGDSVNGETHTVFGELNVPPGSTLTISDNTHVEVDGWSNIIVDGNLNIGSGVEFDFGDGAAFKVNGDIKIQGNETSPVKFTSLLETPAPSSWSGILVQAGAKVEIDYATIEYAEDGVRFLAGSSPLSDQSYIQNSIIRYNTNGISCFGDGSQSVKNPLPLISKNKIYENDVYNIQAFQYANAQSTELDVSNNWWGSEDGNEIVAKIYSHKDYFSAPNIYISPVLNSSGIVSGNVLFGSSISDKTISGKTQIINSYDITTGTTITFLSDSDITANSIIVNGEIDIQSGAKINVKGEIDVNGYLNVYGGPDSPVNFTTDIGLNWGGIVVKPDGSVQINNALIERATNGVTFDGGEGVIQDSLIRWNEIGVLIKPNSSPQLLNNTITLNHYGIYIQGSGNDTTNPQPTITGNNIFDNSVAGLYVSGLGNNTSIVLNVTGNWWGHEVPSPDDIILSNTKSSAVDSSGRLTTANNKKLWPGIYSISVTPHRFSPNGDGNADTTTLGFELSDNINWSVDIKNQSGVVVRNYTGTGTPVTQQWDGRNTTGNYVEDGNYIFNVTAVSPGSTLTASASVQVVVNSQAPTAEITTPVSDGDVWNRIEIKGTASDLTDFNFYRVDIGHYVVGSWVSIQNKTYYQPVVDGVLATIDTNSWALDAPVDNGTYTAKLTVYDKTGNVASIDRVFKVDNIKITDVNHTNEKFHPLLGENGNISFTLDRTADINVLILPEFSNRYIYPIETPETDVIRTMQFASMSSGVHTVTWDGKDDDGNYVKDGAYIYLIAAKNSNGRFSKYSVYPAVFNCGGLWDSSSTIEGEFNPYENKYLTLLINYDSESNCNRDIAVGLHISTDTYEDFYQPVPLEKSDTRLYWGGHSKNGKIMPVNTDYTIYYGGMKWLLTQDAVQYQDVSGIPYSYAATALDMSENHFWVMGDTANVPVPSLKSNPYQIDLSYNQVTEFMYTLDQSAYVTISVLSPDLQHEWIIINNELQSAGDNAVPWNNIPPEIGAEPGFYTFKISTKHPVTGFGVTRYGNITIHR